MEGRCVSTIKGRCTFSLRKMYVLMEGRCTFSLKEEVHLFTEGNVYLPLQRNVVRRTLNK